MATTRIWALHGNVQNAINYIANENKTGEGYVVYPYKLKSEEDL